MSVFQGLVGTYSSKISCDFDSKSNLLDISQRMKEKKINHMPIVENDDFVGLISDRDIKLMAGIERLDELTARDIMKKDLYVVDGKTSLSIVLGKMIEEKLEATLVKENGSLYIFTSTDAMKVLKSIMD